MSQLTGMQALVQLFRENEIPMSDRNSLLRDCIESAMAQGGAALPPAVPALDAMFADSIKTRDDQQWLALPEVRGKFMDYAASPTNENALRIVRAAVERGAAFVKNDPR